MDYMLKYDSSNKEYTPSYVLYHKCYYVDDVEMRNFVVVVAVVTITFLVSYMFLFDGVHFTSCLKFL